MTHRIRFLEDLRADLLDAASEGRLGPEATRLRPRRGPLLAAAAFLVAVVVGGAAVWLGVGRDEVVSPGGPDAVAPIDWDIRMLVSTSHDPALIVADLRSIPGVAEVQYLHDLSAVYAEVGQSQYRPMGPDETPGETMRVDPETDHAAAFAVLLLRLESPAHAESVGLELTLRPGFMSVEYSEAIGAARAEEFFAWVVEQGTVLEEDPLVIQASSGPEPRFDTTDLGIEVVLEPAAPGDVAADFLRDRFPGRPSELDWPDEAHDFDLPHATRPIVHLGYHSDTGMRFVLYPTRGAGMWDTVMTQTGQGGGGYPFTSAHFGLASAGTGSPGGAYATVFVPLHASVVVFTVEDDEPMWQRPFAGWALFPIRWGGVDALNATVEAYDADGALIGSWGTSP